MKGKHFFILMLTLVAASILLFSCRKETSYAEKRTEKMYRLRAHIKTGGDVYSPQIRR